MDKHTQIITDVTALLGSANVAIPLIFGAIAAISAIIKGITGSGPTLSELADQMQIDLGGNDTKIQAEIARLKALLPNP